ncbi:hypothetical protein H310_06014 [Aphanomyces invadans]|uniref:Uncharacterized protein n=1 Tax=Aphanomyces invadans TaxID=157072 RepID=A0A024UA86_9STRA|nr:hypothetical protein H310_06014 [Aphanomyces invadans]ETW02518.1 hypothetical protein H310_06014 [Aphanomyces invadans]|eukprot:XP_008869123.1 hypothetical protein H310_06014 [Aphanomyces invadans]
MIQAIARHQLQSIITHRFTTVPADLLTNDTPLQHFLNDTTDQVPTFLKKTYHSDSANMWIDIQRALRRVKLQFTGVGPTCFQLQVPSFRPPATTKTVLRQLKSHMRDMHYHAWCDLKDQGRTSFSVPRRWVVGL